MVTVQLVPAWSMPANPNTEAGLPLHNELGTPLPRGKRLRVLAAWRARVGGGTGAGRKAWLGEK